VAGGRVLVIKLAEQGRATLDPVLDWFVGVE